MSKTIQIRPLKGIGFLASSLIIFFLVAPTLLVVVLSFGSDSIIRFPPSLFSLRWYDELLQSDEWIGSAQRSVLVGGAAAALAVITGTAAAMALVRGRLYFRRTIDLLALAPMIVPPIVLAVGGYDFFLSLQLTGSLGGLILLHTVLAVPFVILVVTSALQKSNPSLELASLSLGAGPVRTFRSITLPMLWPAMLVGGLFAFLTSFDEVVIAVFLLSGGEPTLPIQIFSSLTTGISPVIAAAAALQVALALVMLGLLALFRRLEQARQTGDAVSEP